MAKAAGRKFWTQVVEEFEGSHGDETHEEFASRRGVEKTTFEKWLYAIRKARSRLPAARAVHLLPVRLESKREEHSISLELGGGLGLRIQAGTDPSYVAALVAALRSC